MTLSGFKDSVMELVHFVGRLASVGLQLEGCHSLLLSFVLDFYETVNELMLIESALWLFQARCNLCLGFTGAFILRNYLNYLKMCFAYCYFPCMFELHCAE